MTSLLRRCTAIAATVLLAVSPQIASAQSWTWWSSADASGVYGNIGSTTVTFLGSYADYENSATASTNYWQPDGAYTQNGLIGPTNPGLIRFRNNGGFGTITFSAPVLNPYIAFNSVGQGGVGVTYDFLGAPFTVLSNNNAGGAYWGSGTHSVAGTVLTGNEFSGVAQFSGVYSSLSFRTTAENWHGITVGVGDTNVVPEPSTYALMAVGMAGIAAIARRRKQAR